MTTALVHLLPAQTGSPARPAASPATAAPTPGSALDRLAWVLDDLHEVRAVDGVVCGHGTVDGLPALAFATDPTRKGGALGAVGSGLVADTTLEALRLGRPVVGVWHSGGARLDEGVGSLAGVASVFAAQTRASGRVPQVSLVLGPAAGGAAYGPALTDVVVLGPQGRLFVTGPDVVRRVTGEDVDMLRLGGPETHGRRSGVAHLTADDDVEAVALTRAVVRLLGGAQQPASGGAPRPDPGALVPAEPRRAYDVRPIVAALLDDEPVELHRRWAPNVVTALGRLDGRAVGVVANNPLRLAGCLDAAAGDKAARFVRTCDAFGLPLVMLVDVPGYLPGLGQETDGVVRRGAKLLHAYAACSVPRVTVITGKAFGGAYIAMGSKRLGADVVLAWPRAQVDVMGPVAAVEVLHRRALAGLDGPEREAEVARLAADHAVAAGGLRRAVELGAVDHVVAPAATRSAVAAALAALPSGRGRPGNTPL